MHDSGTPASGESVAWKIISGTGALSAASSITTIAGEAHITLTPHTTGDITVEAQHGPRTAQRTFTVADHALTLTASPAAIVVGGQSTITASFFHNGGPVPGETITWSVSGAGTLSANSSSTDGSGETNVIVTATGAGPITVQAQYSGPHGTFTRTITLVSSASAPTLAIALSASPTTIDTGDASTLTATLTDNAVPVNAATINWSIVSGPGTLSTPSSNTDASGEATASVTATGSGTIQVQAEYNGVTQQVTITVDANFSMGLSASPTTIDTGDASTLTATLTDNAVPVNAAAINWSIVSGPGTLSTPSSNTDASGEATASVTATGSGTIQVQAEYNGVTQQVTITVDANFSMGLSASPDTIQNGETTQLRATLTDNGYPVDSANILWSIVSGPASLSTSSSLTTGGLATVNVTATGSGSIVIEAEYDGIIKQITITVSADLTLDLDGDETSLLTGESAILTATLYDNGIAVEAANIIWSILGGSGVLSDATSPTDATGVAHSTVTATASNASLIVQATYGSLTQQMTISLTPAFAIATTAGANPILNGGLSVISATLTDNGYPVDSALVTWDVVSGPGTLSGSSSLTVDGVAIIDVVATASGFIQVRATHGLVAASATVLVNSNFALSISPSAGSMQTGNTQPLTAILTDNGLLMDGANITWSVVGPGSLSTYSSTTVAGLGSVILEATGSGTIVIEAAYGGQTAQTTITVTADFVLALQASPLTIYNGDTAALTAILTDNSVPVNPASITWAVVSGPGTLFSPTSSTNTSGIALNNVTATGSGSIVLRATYGALTTEITVTVSPDYAIVVAASNTSPTNGDLVALTATLTDNGIAVPSAIIDWSIEGGTGDGTLTSSTSSTNAGGQATNTFSTSKGGTQTIRATLSAESSIFGTVALTIAPVYSLSIIQSAATIRVDLLNAKTEFTATLLDGGTAVQGAVIEWDIGGLLATITPSSTTNAAGNAKATLQGLILSISVGVTARLQGNPGVTDTVYGLFLTLL